MPGPFGAHGDGQLSGSELLMLGVKRGGLRSLFLLSIWAAGWATASVPLVSSDSHSRHSRRNLQQHQQHQHQQQPEYEVVHFGSAKVAMAPKDDTSTLGEALWSCTQLANTLSAAGGCQQCSFLELGGPGLCALDLAKRLPQLSVNLHPTSRPLADISRGLTGAGQNLQFGGDASQYGSNNRVVLQVNLRRGGCSASLMEVVQKLLSQDAIHTAAVMLPADPQACARQQLLDLAVAATKQNFSVLWGGFDGVNISSNVHQVFEDETYGRQRPVNLFLARRTGSGSAAAPAPKAPTVHVFVPLRAKLEVARNRLLHQMCRFLVDTAAGSNLTLHVVGLTIAGEHLDYPQAVNVQKILILRYALSQPSVAPTDVVAILDASDMATQLSSEALLASFMAAGAPVFHVSTERSIYPPAIHDYAHLYEQLNPTIQLPNKYINSGCMIGRALVMSKYFSDAADFLMNTATNASWLPPQTLAVFLQRRSDQGILSLTYLMGNHYGLSLDYKSQFCISLACQSQNLVLTCPRIAYNLTAAAPAFLHGNGVNGKQQLEDHRDAIVGKGYLPQPSLQLLVDGKLTRYGDFCGDLSKQALDFSGLEMAGPCKIPYTHVERTFPPGCTAAPRGASGSASGSGSGIAG
ncbi:hypothetical protein PLESTM_000944500 [Pleodorina starrii]|nr:hypothetical protein PLESTM_000944500 [Pleodorina starrii]